MPRKPKDLTGQRFGQLVALEYSVKEFGAKRHRKGVWKCLCDCGNTKEVQAANLLSGTSSSCGCFSGGVVEEKPGTRYGRLTVLKRADGAFKWEKGWLCRCDCGKELVVRGKSLRQGKTTSCGCFNRQATSGRSSRDITGQRFGRLLAIKPVDRGRKHSSGKPKKEWLFQCDCGNETYAQVTSVVTGNTQSCGCLAKETSPLNFHNEGHRAYAEDTEYAERQSLIYLIEVADQYDKIGITFDLTARFKKGECTEVWWTKTMPRAACWAVEQAALACTWDNAAVDVPKEIATAGTSEFREGLVLADTIQLLEDLSTEALEMGWRAFYEKHLL